MKLRTTAFVIAAAISFAAPAAALAQDTTTDPAMTTGDTGDDRGDDSGKWGLLGLLGLAGLMGLKRRDDDRRGNTGSGTGTGNR